MRSFEQLEKRELLAVDAALLAEVSFKESIDSADFYRDPEMIAAIVDPGLNRLVEQFANDPGLNDPDNPEIEYGQLNIALDDMEAMNQVITEAIVATGIADDGHITVEETFVLNSKIIEMTTGIIDDPSTPGHDGNVWVNSRMEELARDTYTVNRGQKYYQTPFGDWHGNDENRRRERETTGQQVEHGFHLVENDGATTTEELFLPLYFGYDRTVTTTIDGIGDYLYHIGYDIVYRDLSQPVGQQYSLETEFDPGKDSDNYYLLNQNGARDRRVSYTTDILNHYLERDLATAALTVPNVEREEVQIELLPYATGEEAIPALPSPYEERAWALDELLTDEDENSFEWIYLWTADNPLWDIFND